MPKHKLGKKGERKKQSAVEKLAEESKLQAYGVYDRISKIIVGGKKTWRKNKHEIEDILDNESNFIDKEYVPNQYQLDRLQVQNSKLTKEVNWFKLHNFFKKEKYSITGDCQIRKQVMKNRGYVWVVDALNVISTQPGLVLQLFEKKKAVREGVYAVWLNFNGKWTQFIIDDHTPIFQNMNGKTQFLFSSPHPKFKEIWYILLEKAMAKAYGGYYRLMQGVENYAVKDLTGAPYDIFEIVYIKPGRGVTKRDRKHMRSFWKKVNHWLKKGYILSICPREPTQMEKFENKKMNIPNKKYYLSKGLYSGHNYAIVTTAEVDASTGEKSSILKLRNPWLNEKWEGDWSKNSSLWTEKTKKDLNYDKEKENDFWMSVQDLMGYFECMNIYKTVPGHTFNNLPIEFRAKKYGRVVIRVTVPLKGKYTFSVDQKDLRSYECPNLKYCRIKLTLGKLEESGVTLLSHTSSLKLRNTFIRKSIEKGEYYLLVERTSSDENKKLIKSNSEFMDSFNEVNISTYGPKTCSLKIAEPATSGDTLYNFLSYHGWKSYSARRIGKKMSSFKVNFYDQSWNQMSLYLLNIPDSMIYAFKNSNDFGVELKSQIAGITNKEIVGPEGRIGFRQDFSMNSGTNDIFILRDKDDDEYQSNQPVNHKFQIKSIVGRKFYGTKGNHENFKNVYDFLIQEKGKKKLTEIEKDKILEDKIGLFDGETGDKLEYKVEVVDEVKKRQIVVPMKKEDYEDIVNLEEVEKKEKEVEEEQERRRKIEEERKRKEKERLMKEEDKVRREFELRNGIIPKKPQIFQSESCNDLIKEKSEIEKNMSPDNKTKLKQEESHPQIKNSEINESKKNIEDKEKPVVKKVREQKNIIESEIEKDKKDLPLVALLKKTKNSLLLLKNSEIKTLIKYFSFKGLSIVYKLDNEFIKKLREKLKNDEEGLSLMDNKRVEFKYNLGIKEGKKKRTAQKEEYEKERKTQRQLEKELGEQKKLEAQIKIPKNLSNFKLKNIAAENKKKPQPTQQIQKVESPKLKDDYQASRRNQNNINSIQELQKPLRSMSRAMSPKFNRSISRKKLEKNQKKITDFGSPNERDILKQNKQNKVTLSQYNMTDGGALSVGLSRVDSTCNISNMGQRETLDFLNLRQGEMRRSCDISEKNRHSYSIGELPFTDLKIINDGMKAKNFRNSYHGNKTSFTTNNSLRNSSALFEPEKYSMEIKSELQSKNNLNLDPNDNNRMERLKKKLDERWKLQNLALKKKKSMKKSFSFHQKKNPIFPIPNKKEEIRKSYTIQNPKNRTQEIRKSYTIQNPKIRTQEIINNVRQIVHDVHKTTVKKNSSIKRNSQYKKVEMNLDEKLKNIRSKVQNKYARRNISENKMRNTLNTNTFGIERDAKLDSNLNPKNISELSYKKNQFENKSSFKSRHTSIVGSLAEKKKSCGGERITMEARLGSSQNGFNKFKAGNFRHSLNPTLTKSNSRALGGNYNKQVQPSSKRIYPEQANTILQNQVNTPNKIKKSFSKKHKFNSDRKVFKKRNQNNTKTNPFKAQFLNIEPSVRKSTVLSNQLPNIKNGKYQLGMNKNIKPFEERTKNNKKMSSINNLGKGMESFASSKKINQSAIPSQYEYGSPKKKLEFHHKKNKSHNFVNSKNLNKFLSPNRRNNMNRIGRNVLHTRLDSGSKGEKYNKTGQKVHGRDKKGYLNGFFG